MNATFDIIILVIAAIVFVTLKTYADRKGQTTRTFALALGVMVVLVSVLYVAIDLF
jgi:glycerol uptake facilitator-like aquaporin